MTELTRRGFVVQASFASAAAASGAAAATLLTSRDGRPLGPLPQTLVLHVQDIESSTVSLMTEGTEVVFQDAELVTSLLKAAAKAGR